MRVNVSVRDLIPSVIMVLCVLCCFKTQVAIDAPEQVFEACYGTTTDDFLEPICNSTEVLYIRDVYTFVKPDSYACPQTSTTTNRNDSFCCHYNNDTTDCGWRYYGDAYKGVHYTNCVGLPTCKVNVAWNGTNENCNQGIFMSKTNYMRQFFHCIKSSLISNICHASVNTGNQLYVWNDGYPATSADCAASSGCVCSVSASKGSSIHVELLDLRLQEAANGTCYQRLVISEGALETSINCDKKNEFSLTSIYTSQSDSLSIRYDNTHAGSGGNFWISLQAIDSTSLLTMTCGNSSAVYSCGESLPPSLTASTTDFSSNTTTNIPATVDTITTSNTATNIPTTTVTITSNTTSFNTAFATNANMGQSKSEDSSDSDKLGLVAGLVAGALLLAVIAVLAGGLRYRFRKNKVNINDEYSEHFGTLKDAKNIAPVGYRQMD